MTRKNKTISGFLWVSAGTAGQNLLQFIALLVLARLISPEEFGLVSAAMIVIGLIQIFSDMGVGPAIVQFKNLDDTYIGTGKTLSALLGFLMGGAVYLFAGYYESFMGVDGLKDTVQLLSLALPIAGMAVVQQALLQRDLQFNKLIKFIFLSHVLGQIGVAVPLAILGFGYKALIYSVLAQNLCLMILVNVGVGKGFAWYRIDFNAARKILNFGFGQSLGKFSNYAAGQADNLIVGKFLGAAALGFYTRAYQLMVMPVNLIGGTIDKVMFPVMSRIQDENEKLAGMYIDCTSLLLMIFTPITVFGVLCSREIMLFLFGESWLPAAPALQILMSVIFFRVSYKISDSLSRAKGSVYRRAWRQMIYAVLVGLGAYLGHFYGLQGVAIGVLMAISCNYLMMLQLSFNLIKVDASGLAVSFAKNLVVLLVCLVCVWAVKSSFLPDSVDGKSAFFNILICVSLSFLFSVLGWAFLYRMYGREISIFKGVLSHFAKRI